MDQPRVNFQDLVSQLLEQYERAISDANRLLELKSSQQAEIDELKEKNRVLRRTIEIINEERPVGLSDELRTCQAMLRATQEENKELRMLLEAVSN